MQKKFEILLDWYYLLGKVQIFMQILLFTFLTMFESISVKGNGVKWKRVKRVVFANSKLAGIAGLAH